MTLEQLRIFVAVAELQHVTRAAQMLHLSASAVSNAIAALEERHVIRLFDRVGRNIALSADGRAFLPHARKMLECARSAEAALTDLRKVIGGSLVLRATPAIANYWLPRNLIGFQADNPLVRIDLTTGRLENVVAAILQGEAEVGFVEGLVDAPMLETAIIAEDRLAVVVNRSHPWATCKRLAVDALATTPWVMREATSGTRRSVDAALKGAGIDVTALNIRMTLPSNLAILAAVAAGVGAAALSENSVAAATAGLELVRAPVDLPARYYRMIWHRHRYISRTAQLFKDAIIREASSDHLTALAPGTARRANNADNAKANDLGN
jgi:DNA-binding transcriptional LysR family regulator